jgi:hypothetical protein
MSVHREITRLVESKADIEPALAWVSTMTEKALAGGPVQISLGRERRSLDQNAKFHPMINDIHQQGFRGYSFAGVKAVLINQFALEMAEQGEPLGTPGEKTWDWKTHEPVYVRPSSKDFKKSEAIAFIEWLYAEGSGLAVQWSEKAQSIYDQVSNAK